MAAIRWGIAAAAVCLASATAWASAPAATQAKVFEARAGDGRLVAFDDGTTGGEHAIRVYDAQGKLVRELALADFLPADYVRALPRSESGLQWRRDAKLAPSQASVDFSVAVPGEGEALSFSIDLRDGVVRTSQIREYLAAADQARTIAANPLATAAVVSVATP